MTPTRALVDLLNDRVASRQWGTGWQVSIRTRCGYSLDLVGGHDGTGRATTATTPFCVYCAGKPVTALCIGALVDRRQISLHDRLGDVVNGIIDPTLADVTIDELLRHTAGLGRYPAAAFLAQPAAKRDTLLRRLKPQSPRPNSTTYSEFVAWELLRLVIESVSGDSFEQVVERRLLGPLGLRDAMRYTLKPDESGSLGLNVAIRASGLSPLLWEHSTTNLTECKASTGMITTASALATFYYRLDAAMESDRTFPITKATLQLLTEQPSTATYDPVLGRTCKLARGFMVDLREHMFGPLNNDSFGHSGLSGMTFAGCDRTSGYAFAVHINGYIERDHRNFDRRAEVRRQAVMTALAETIAAVE